MCGYTWLLSFLYDDCAIKFPSELLQAEKNTLIIRRRSNISGMYVEVLMKLNFLFTCLTCIYVWLKQKGHEEKKRLYTTLKRTNYHIVLSLLLRKSIDNMRLHDPHVAIKIS